MLRHSLLIIKFSTAWLSSWFFISRWWYGSVSLSLHLVKINKLLHDMTSQALKQRFVEAHIILFSGASPDPLLCTSLLSTNHWLPGWKLSKWPAFSTKKSNPLTEPFNNMQSACWLCIFCIYRSCTTRREPGCIRGSGFTMRVTVAFPSRHTEQHHGSWSKNIRFSFEYSSVMTVKVSFLMSI